MCCWVRGFLHGKGLSCTSSAKYIRIPFRYPPYVNLRFVITTFWSNRTVCPRSGRNSMFYYHLLMPAVPKLYNKMLTWVIFLHVVNMIRWKLQWWESSISMHLLCTFSFTIITFVLGNHLTTLRSTRQILLDAMLEINRLIDRLSSGANFLSQPGKENKRASLCPKQCYAKHAAYAYDMIFYDLHNIEKLIL